MSNKGLNSTEMKVRNRSKILNMLRNCKGLSRKDISDQMGLTKAAITGLISALINEGIILETGTRDTGLIGRKKIALALNKTYGYAIGLSICETHFSIVITNILGETIDLYFHEFIGTPEFSNDLLVKLATDKSLDLLQKNSINRSSVLGFGIGYLGEMGFFDIPYIISQIKSSLGFEVYAGNNVKTLAMAQMDFGTEASNDFLFVKYGPGLGMSIVQNGIIVDGVEDKAGEIGHTIIDKNANTKCRCGRKGCLESLISEKGIVRDIEKLGGDYTSLILNKNLSIIDYEKVNELLEQKDPTIISIFEPRYEYFAQALANGIILFDPEFICVYGMIFRQQALFKLICRKVSSYLGTDISSKIKLSNLDPANNAIEHATLVLRSIFYSTGGYHSND